MRTLLATTNNKRHNLTCFKWSGSLKCSKPDSFLVKDTVEAPFFALVFFGSARTWPHLLWWPVAAPPPGILCPGEEYGSFFPCFPLKVREATTFYWPQGGPHAHPEPIMSKDSRSTKGAWPIRTHLRHTEEGAKSGFCWAGKRQWLLGRPLRVTGIFFFF